MKYRDSPLIELPSVPHHVSHLQGFHKPDPTKFEHFFVILFLENKWYLKISYLLWICDIAKEMTSSKANLGQDKIPGMHVADKTQISLTSL